MVMVMVILVEQSWSMGEKYGQDDGRGRVQSC